jgi:glucose-1-phosphatase
VRESANSLSTGTPIPFAAVLFDLADVLLEFRGHESVARFSGGRVGPDEFGKFWASPAADAWYKGECSPDTFAAAAVGEMGLMVSPQTFLDEFRTWLRGPYPGAFELVAEVRERVPVGCLSNTNALDVMRFRREFDFARRFDHCFFSNEIGWRKPEPGCYSHVLAHLGLASDPGRVVFFDDSAACIAGARDAGMLAYQVTGIATTRAHLELLDIL